MITIANNLKIIRQNLAYTQLAISKALDIGFRTYVRYETGQRNVPVSVLVKFASLGNISIDRLLTTLLTTDDIENPDSTEKPITPQQMDIISGGIEEGRVMFKGLINDYSVTKNQPEKKLITEYRKLKYARRKKCLLDAEWILNNPKVFEKKNNPIESNKNKKEKNKLKLLQIANSINKNIIFQKSKN